MEKKDFERFIAVQFVNFYNKYFTSSFTFMEKSDEIDRNKPSPDFLYFDSNSENKIFLEIKRLFSPKNSKYHEIKNRANKYVCKPLKGIIRGEYWLRISDTTPNNFTINDFISPYTSKNSKDLFDEIRNEIIMENAKAPFSYYELKCCKGTSLLRFSEEGSDITAWPVELPIADDSEIVRMLDESIKKFHDSRNINIILLVELSESSRGNKIASIIENLKFGIEPGCRQGISRSFDSINGIFYLGIANRKTVIAQAFPQHIETKFYDPSDDPKSHSNAIKYLL